MTPTPGSLHLTSWDPGPACHAGPCKDQNPPFTGASIARRCLGSEAVPVMHREAHGHLHQPHNVFTDTDHLGNLDFALSLKMRCMVFVSPFVPW